MAAYLVVMQEVEDVDRYRAEYTSAMGPLLKKHGAVTLVGSFSAEAAEGEPPNSTVVLRFADVAAAWGLLDDPEYQALKAIRLSVTSRGQMVIAPEFVPPK